jgi:hypothetical protein
MRAQPLSRCLIQEGVNRTLTPKDLLSELNDSLMTAGIFLAGAGVLIVSRSQAKPQGTD